jgi:SAM-dependent methyltransferase
MINHELVGTWKNLDMNNLHPKMNRKWLNRGEIMNAHWEILTKYLPECFEDGRIFEVIDFSCGSGSMMEILRSHGHKVKGVDYDKSYLPLTESQGLEVVYHDGRKFPYPLENRCCDILICWGAMTFYKPVTNWQLTLDEFARMARKTILIGVNKGAELDEGRMFIDSWSNSRFELVLNNDYIWKWVAK